MAKQIDYPADTVDSSGKVWDTVGENIRHGEKSGISEILIKFRHDTLDALFPVNYIFVGQLPELLKTEFTWQPYSGVYKPMGIFTYKPNNTDELPHGSTSNTIPLLTQSELETFNSVTGLNKTNGAFDIPIYQRIS